MISSDQGEFLDQLKNFARGFLGWIQEEGREEEHPGIDDIDAFDALPQGSNTPGGGAVPMPSAPNEEEQVQPMLLRSRTTTVHDYTPGGATPGAAVPGSATPTAPTHQSASMATDPPVSQAQRGAMHAAAQGNSNLGIPSSVGKEFANADPGGKLPEKKGEDDTGGAPGAERFSLSPDGQTIVDNVGGKSYPIQEAMRILFSGDQPQDASVPSGIPPAGKVTVNPVDNPEVNTAKWSVPKIEPPGKDVGEGMGGIVLGQLLRLKAGEGPGGARSTGAGPGPLPTGAQPQKLPPRGNGAGLQPRHGAMPVRDHGAGWQSPQFKSR